MKTENQIKMGMICDEWPDYFLGCEQKAGGGPNFEPK